MWSPITSELFLVDTEFELDSGFQLKIISSGGQWGGQVQVSGFVTKRFFLSCTKDKEPKA